jgi:hypothetical protein
MMRPQPPRLRMKRRKTVSVTPAMGARTVAGEIVTEPICRVFGTGARGACVDRTFPFDMLSKDAAVSEQPLGDASRVILSQNFFTFLFYLPDTLAPARKS